MNRHLKKEVFARLAAYFRSKADPAGDGSWQGNNARVFDDLVYYELRALQLECARVEAETADDWRGHIAAGTRPAHHNGNSADGYGPTHHVIFPVMAHGDAFPELLGHPRILSALRQFMGVRIINSDNGLCIKPPRTETHVGWHRCAPIPASPGKPQ